MPTTYTHDLFGREVYRKLPKEIRGTIKRHGDLYRIGLHGPDIIFYYNCFYYNKINQYGVSMHKQPAREFFEKGLTLAKETKDEALLVYLLGFANHFLLDSQAHPFVISLDQKGKWSHTVQEKEFDRLLMLEQKKNPYLYHPSDCIVPKEEYAEVIHKAIPTIPAAKILHSLKMMKFITNLMVYGHGRRHRIILPVLTMAGQKKMAGEFFMGKYMPLGVRKCLESLKERCKEAEGQAVEILPELYDMVMEDDRPIVLSERFDLTYNG